MEAEAAVTHRLLTIEDLEALPEDGHVYELIAGELRRRPDVGGALGAIGGDALYLLGTCVAEHRLGRGGGRSRFTLPAGRLANWK